MSLNVREVGKLRLFDASILRLWSVYDWSVEFSIIYMGGGRIESC